MSLEDFLSEVFYNTSAVISDISKEDKIKFDKKVSNMIGLVKEMYPELPPRSDISEFWAVELYKLDLNDYAESAEFGNRLEMIIGKLEDMGKESVLHDQLSKTFVAQDNSPFIPNVGCTSSSEVTPLEHYFSCISYYPECWVPELLDCLIKYDQSPKESIKLFKAKTQNFVSISKHI